MDVEYSGQSENREIKKFNLALNKANLTNLWDNRFFNMFVNGTQIFSFPANTDYFSLKDNTIYLRVLATSNIFRIKEKIKEISFKIANDETNFQTKFKVNNVEVFELKNVGIGVPVLGLCFNVS